MRRVAGDNLPGRRALTGLAALPSRQVRQQPNGASASPRRKPAKPTVQHVDVAIIGAGVFGAWTAWHLLRAGKSVRLFDAYGVGHVRSSSGGESRVIRMGYGADTIYSEMARESLPYWKALSDSASSPIFHNTGVLWFGPTGDAYRAVAGVASGQPRRPRAWRVSWLWDDIARSNSTRARPASSKPKQRADRRARRTRSDCRRADSVERVVMPAPLLSKRIKRHSLRRRHRRPSRYAVGRGS